MRRLLSRGLPRRYRPIAGPAAVVALAVAGAGWTAANDPEQYPARFPSCPIRAVTGLQCPGCGGTRMAHHLLHGRWGAALRANPVLLVAGLPLLGWLWLRWAVAAVRGERPDPVPRPVVIAAVVVAFGWVAVRNAGCFRR